MKNILIILFLGIQIGVCQTNKSILKFDIESVCPNYVLNNICAKNGLTNIIAAATVDERVQGINTSNANDPKNPEIAIKYLNTIFVFEKGFYSEDLQTFRIYFDNYNDLINFFNYYSKLTGMHVDPNNSKRCYLEENSMNAITINSDPSNNNYFAICFIFGDALCKAKSNLIGQ